MIELTRRYRFSASHRLHSPALSDAENDELYGKCNNPFGHGHNYEIEVTVRGEVDDSTGRVVDLASLDELIRGRVTGPFEHRNLNVEVPEFQSLTPTTENLGMVIDKRLRSVWSEAFPAGTPKLKRIRIYETERNIFVVERTGNHEIQSPG